MAGPSRRTAGLLAAGAVLAAGLAGCGSDKMSRGEAEGIRRRSDEKHREIEEERRDVPSSPDNKR